MNLDIVIRHEDVGFRYEEIKSLLSKFRSIEINKQQLQGITLTIDLNAQDCHELSGGLIWRLARYYQNLKLEKKLYSQPEAEEVLKNWHFFDSLTGQHSTDISKDVPLHLESFTPFRNLKETVNGTSAEQVYKNAMKTALNKDDPLHHEVSIGILEIINNVFDHSEHKTEAGIICSKKESSRHIAICAVDMGQGIKSSFLTNPFLRNDFISLSDEKAIEQATHFNVSCNPGIARNPNYPITTNAGMGLYYLKTLAKMHRDGQLIIISGKGYYYVDHEGREIKRNFQSESWPGTLVYFRVDLTQPLNPKFQDLAQSV